MRCAVTVCNVDSQSRKFTKNVKFFRFPTDPNLQKAWIIACNRGGKFSLNNARVCSNHFQKESYQRILKHELLGYSPKNCRLLKPDAVPTLNLTLDLPRLTKETNCSMKPNETKLVEVEDILAAKSVNKCKVDVDASRNDEIKDSIKVVSSVVSSTKVNPICVSDNLSSGSPTERDISINTNNESQEETISKLKEEIEHLKNENKALKKIFTATQIKKLKNPKERIKWTKENISEAIVIYSAGSRAYRLLLRKGYPLPAVSTLRAYAARRLKLEPKGY